MARSELEPWIEKLILRYDGSEQETNRRLLKAHVVGVGHMSQSQAQTVQQQGTTELIFLSDGVVKKCHMSRSQSQTVQQHQGTTELVLLSDGLVQVPAILTASALEDLQEREDRDSQSTLVDSTVRVQCRVDFYAHPRQERSGFFLFVSKLATVAAGPHKGGTPPCTRLASVRQHVCKTWRLAHRQDSVHGSQNSQQHGFDLSQLLWTWDHDALRDVQMDALTALQPSTSSCNPAARHEDARTSWEADRITNKSAEFFILPVCHLLIPEPEEEAQRPLKAVDQVSSETTNGILIPPDHVPNHVPDHVPDHSQAVYQMAGHLNAQTFPPETVVTLSPPGSQEDASPQENTLKSGGANPWDAFAPPIETLLCTPSSRSDESITPEAIPPKTPTDRAGITFQVEGVPLATSTQVSSRGSSDISQTSERSEGEQSSIHLYRKPRPTLRLSPLHQKSKPTHRLVLPSDSSTSESSVGSVNGSLNVSSHAKNRCSRISTRPLLLSGQENLQAEKETGTQEEEEVARGKRKRGFHHCNSDVLPALKEEVCISSSPPTWLIESQQVSTRAQVGRGVKQTRSTEEGVLTVQSTVHSNGAPLSYAYDDEPDAREQLLQELFKFKVSEGTLRWAVNYLRSDIL